jgi:ribonuclease-3
MREGVAQVFGLEPDAEHLTEALTHPSYRNERAIDCDNQRLEFLGDAVLGFCVADMLYSRFADADEGRLTRMRARLVNGNALARWARENGLAQALLLGRGATTDGLADSTNVLADAVEALIAATYLDAGLDVARRICARIVAEELESIETSDGPDPKSELQERVQARGRQPPTYQVEQSGGPPHDRWFLVSVRLGATAIAVGRGRSKRAAEQAAASEALASGIWQVATEGAKGSKTEVQR